MQDPNPNSALSHSQPAGQWVNPVALDDHQFPAPLADFAPAIPEHPGAVPRSLLLHGEHVAARQRVGKQWKCRMNPVCTERTRLVVSSHGRWHTSLCALRWVVAGADAAYTNAQNALTPSVDRLRGFCCITTPSSLVITNTSRCVCETPQEEMEPSAVFKACLQGDKHSHAQPHSGYNLNGLAGRPAVGEPSLARIHRRGWRYSSGEGDEWQRGAMVRAGFRVDGSGGGLSAAAWRPCGRLQTLAGRDGGERTQQETLPDRG